MSPSSTTFERPRRKAVWGPKRTAALLLSLLVLGAAPALAGGHAHRGQKARPGQVGGRIERYKLDHELTFRAGHRNPEALTRVIVTLVPGATLPPEFKRFTRGGKLDLINGQTLELPNGVLQQLAAHPDIFQVHYDRPAGRFNYRTGVAVGAAVARQAFGYSGAGIGVAVIDSGIATWHDDLTGRLGPYGNQRVVKFVDFVNGRTQPYDDNGHGSHVSGTILGNGKDSRGQKSGMAPGASLISLKVLDANGHGTISNIIAALGWVAANYRSYNIRVVNLSIGAGIFESYWTDPLTLACKALTDKGIVVVAAAGNLGTNAQGQPQWGGITAPANAPWVLSVGASSTMGTLTRRDDTMASFSSRGPSYIDYGAKPDLVAPGVGTVSLAVPGSTFYTSKSQYLLHGASPSPKKPYLALSGTSMAAPVVSGTVALMLQANPHLTPNLVKAILQYTAQVYPGYKPLQEGAGFLNALGAVQLARYYATARIGDSMPVSHVWGRRVIWGNHMIAGGYMNPKANAWADNIVWGSAATPDGDNIVWGSMCGDGACDNIVWGSLDADNIVWGSALEGDNIVWGSSFDGDNIVWGSGFDDNIVWGSDCGGADCDNIVWGSMDADNIVWGSAEPGDNIVWGSGLDADNIVWGSSLDADNIVWGSSLDADNIVWGSSLDVDNIVWGSDNTTGVMYDDSATETLPDVTLELGELVIPRATVRPTAARAGGGR